MSLVHKAFESKRHSLTIIQPETGGTRAEPFSSAHFLAMNHATLQAYWPLPGAHSLHCS